MNELLEKFNEYKEISNYRIKYTLINGDVIDFKLKQTDFPHLIGLHKLIDIPLIGQFNDISNITVSAKFPISKIKKESQLTESSVKNSVYFPEIAQRYQNFSKDNLLTLTYTDAIVDFDASLIGSRLRGDYILFENQRSQGYNYLSIAKDKQQLLVTFDMKRQNDVRDILSANGVKYAVKVTNRQNAAILGSSRTRTGSFGLNTNLSYEYKI